MPLYMYQAGYTAESVASLLEEPRDRITSVAKAFEDMGAEYSWAAIRWASTTCWLSIPLPTTLPPPRSPWP